MPLYRGRTTEELIIIGFAAVSLCGQVPYGIYRLMVGDWLVAAVDFFGAALCCTAIYQVVKHQRVEFFGRCLSIAAVCGVLLIVNNKGAQDVPFMYPVLLLSYFLLSPRWALSLSIVAVACLGLILHDQLALFHFSKVILSLLGCSMFAYIFASLRNAQAAELQQLSTMDALTGALNRRSLDLRLEQFILQQQRQPRDAALVIIDLDNFKDINDRYGHGVGDAVLKRVTETIAQRIRATDQLYRYGGDEFVVFVNDASLQQAMGLAEDLRARVEATEAMEGSNLSISLGVSAFKEGQTADQWLASADTGLLSAKSSGRNQIQAAS